MTALSPGADLQRKRSKAETFLQRCGMIAPELPVYQVAPARSSKAKPIHRKNRKPPMRSFWSPHRLPDHYRSGEFRIESKPSGSVIKIPRYPVSTILRVAKACSSFPAELRDRLTVSARPSREKPVGAPRSLLAWSWSHLKTMPRIPATGTSPLVRRGTPADWRPPSSAVTIRDHEPAAVRQDSTLTSSSIRCPTPIGPMANLLSFAN